ncbi:urokinase plasminogen activator surface receptor-like [Colossoma macropomum]|uniref:urokinase plasminogen activator surface receptor-like n=1 Tax=Colossoma macropomum TaxID=42526 RepID=UPI00186538C2|nr:urokinase plasminogen activator surface receptor-like [Colossoma macropomum]
MRLQVTLLLVCVFFPKVLTLMCYECISGLSGLCTDTQTYCSSQCASMTTATYVGGVQTGEVNMKGCAAAGQCVSGSLNLGLLKTTINSKCCSTYFCNSYKAPALPKGSPNGRKCYTCADDDCFRTVDCEGDEDQCISGRVSVGGAQMKMKGCASRSYCSADLSRTKAAGISGSLSCCEGNLCNSAEGVKLSLLIMLVPLISSILFI